MTGKPDQEEIIFKQVLEIAPENEAVYLRLAGFYQRFNKLTEAEATLQSWQHLSPNKKNYTLSWVTTTPGSASQRRLLPAIGVRQRSRPARSTLETS